MRITSLAPVPWTMCELSPVVYQLAWHQNSLWTSVVNGFIWSGGGWWEGMGMVYESLIWTKIRKDTRIQRQMVEVVVLKLVQNSQARKSKWYKICEVTMTATVLLIYLISFSQIFCMLDVNRPFYKWGS